MPIMCRSLSASRAPPICGFIHAAGPLGMHAGKSRLLRLSWRWESRRRLTFQTISEKTGTYDGRPRIEKTGEIAPLPGESDQAELQLRPERDRQAVRHPSQHSPTLDKGGASDDRRSPSAPRARVSAQKFLGCSATIWMGKR